MKSTPSSLSQMAAEPVFGVLVAYNPDPEEFSRNLDRLAAQVDHVVLCNNSIDPVAGPKENITVLNFGQNLGIAEAQSVGMAWAFSHGAAYVIQMDQDSILEPGTVDALVACYQLLRARDFSVGILGPTHYDKYTGQEYKARWDRSRPVREARCAVVSEIASSGSLIPKSSYDLVGGMEDGLFIDGVDFEYCWRLKKWGLKTIRAENVRMGHRLGSGAREVLGSVSVTVPVPIRHYYHIRNVFLLLLRGYVPLIWKVSNLLKLAVKLVLYPLTFADGKERVAYMLLGIRHGILGYHGRIDKLERT